MSRLLRESNWRRNGGFSSSPIRDRSATTDFAERTTERRRIALVLRLGSAFGPLRPIVNRDPGFRQGAVFAANERAENRLHPLPAHCCEYRQRDGRRYAITPFSLPTPLSVLSRLVHNDRYAATSVSNDCGDHVGPGGLRCAQFLALSARCILGNPGPERHPTRRNRLSLPSPGRRSPPVCPSGLRHSGSRPARSCDLSSSIANRAPAEFEWAQLPRQGKIRARLEMRGQGKSATRRRRVEER